MEALGFVVCGNAPSLETMVTRTVLTRYLFTCLSEIYIFLYARFDPIIRICSVTFLIHSLRDIIEIPRQRIKFPGKLSIAFLYQERANALRELRNSLCCIDVVFRGSCQWGCS